MANKTFLKANELYDAPDKRNQNDVEINGATILRSGGRISKLEFSSNVNSSTTSYNDLTDKPIIPPPATDYFIRVVNSTVTSLDKNGATAFTGTDAYTVIQSCITSLQTGNGGRIVMGSGTYNLTNELILTGWDAAFDPKGQICIEGQGYSTIITQNTAGKNAFVFKNKIAATLKNLYINVGAAAKSALFGDATGAQFEISLYEATIDNIKVTHAGTAPGVYLKNFFNVSVPHLDVISSSNTAIQLESASVNGQNYGNSNFGFVHATGSTSTGFAGLALISDVPFHPLNLCNFNTLAVGGGYYGVYMKGAAYNTFGLADIEYVSKSVHLDNGANGVTTGNNSFLSMYLYTNVGGTAIYCNSNTYGNSFHGRIESDDATLTVINDLQQFQAANSYDVTLGFSIGTTPTITIATPAQTRLIYRKVADGLTVVQGPGAGAATDLTSVASNVVPSTGNTRDLGGSVNYWANLYAQNVRTPTIIGRVGAVAITSASSGTGIDISLNNTATKVGSFFGTTGNLALQQGGTYTDNGSRLQTTSFSTALVAKTAAYTATAADNTITGDATTATFSITLPTAVGCSGREYLVKKIDASANAVTVATTSSQTIDGATTYALPSQWKFVRVKSNGANWIIIGSN